MSHTHPDFETSGDQVKIVRLSERHRDDLSALPPPETVRWVMSRKAQVVEAVRRNILTFREACERYSLSEEEFSSWMNRLDQHGMRGLRATRVQEYREDDHPSMVTAE